MHCSHHFRGERGSEKEPWSGMSGVRLVCYFQRAVTSQWYWLGEDSFQLPQALRLLLGTFWALDQIRALQRVLIVMLDPKPSKLRPSWHLPALTVRMWRPLFRARLQLCSGDVYGHRMRPPVHISCTWQFSKRPVSSRVATVYIGQSTTLSSAYVVSSLRPVGAYTVYLKGIRWRASTASYTVQQPNVWSASPSVSP
jgi:hypothetical protein